MYLYRCACRVGLEGTVPLVGEVPVGGLVINDNPTHASVVQVHMIAIASHVNVFRQIKIDLDDIERLPGDHVIRWLGVAA